MPRFAFAVFLLAVVGCANTEKQVAISPQKPVSPAVGASAQSVLDSTRSDAPAELTSVPDTISAEPVEVLDLKVDSASDPVGIITTKIDTTITLGAWLKSHPADAVSVVAPVGNPIDDRFCRAAVVKVRVGQRTLVRSALFYIPPAPKGERLPVDTANAAKDMCDLRTMVLASEETGPEGHALRDSLALLIDKRLGAHSDGLPLAAGGIIGTEEGFFWRRPETSVVVAIAPADQPSRLGSHHAEENAASKATFAVAYAPGSGAADFDIWQPRREELASRRIREPEHDLRAADSALAWANMPAVTADLKTVIAYLRTRDLSNTSELKPAQVDVPLLRALRAIHQAAPSLPPSRRAAALLAGDVALGNTYWLPSADSGKAIVNALPSLDITMEVEESEGGRYYAHDWLWEAYRADSTGPAGRSAFVQLLGMRWPENNSCDGDEYKRVIERGEAAVARGNNDPLIHFYLGSAYKTLYDLAHYENSEVGNPGAYKAQAGPARLKGIEHFRTALQSLADPALRREAWLKGMRLILSRSGEQPEYVCFAD